jgi:hypothetical protein
MINYLDQTITFLWKGFQCLPMGIDCPMRSFRIYPNSHNGGQSFSLNIEGDEATDGPNKFGAHWTQEEAVEAGETELARILQPSVMNKTKNKEASKPIGSATPGKSDPLTQSVAEGLTET